MKKVARRLILKIIFNCWCGVSYIYQLGRVKTILFYPHLPDCGTVIYKLAKILGCRITNNPNRKHDLAIHWEDITIRKSEPVLVQLNQAKPVLNFACRDITKSNVNEKFKDIFNYDSFLDPLIFKGKCLKKTEINGQHDAIAIDCPIPEKEEGYVYQKIFSCKEGENQLVEYRTTVIKDDVPLVYVTFRPDDNTFGKIIASSYVADSKDAFSTEEINKIVEFCKYIGLDYGELDIIRDDQDGRIYILDCNNTPGGPTKITGREMFFALRTLSLLFKKSFLEDNPIPAYT